MKEIKLFINGTFKTSEKSFITENPANGEAVAKVYLPTEKILMKLLKQLRQLFTHPNGVGWIR